ncbi:hypothetical protein [Cellulomonas soli]|uniref:Uncharacterized protein n=1 Tax=Cellulomonas soli TaxID=931535 RepID=A0A512PHP1_9CELL|nr:hypothetical protein [Cellulomonas soli]NYI59209.1 hypothetical protein [Cellulomonas soli]GEP70714.1 hypothetical protein CSO01_34290 [Cellulomonas soli]
MSETSTRYVDRAPGDLLTAEDWNTLQDKIHDDIRSTAQTAADAVTHVHSADDSTHLEGKGLDALTEEITKRVLDEVRGRTGYQQLFLVLKNDEPQVVEHGLGTPPLVDLYRLEYFEVVSREDDETRDAWATFYLHHSEERRIRVTGENNERRSVDIQPPDGPEMGIPFADMLTRYGVEYTDTSTLDDLETEFWKAFFRAPNEQFNDDQYTHSPWFERCCKEQQTVRKLKANGDWNDIVFQVRPRKSVNFETSTVLAGGGKDGGDATITLHPHPTSVFVQHLDNNRLALWYLGVTPADTADEIAARDYIGGTRYDREQKLMVLLKV